MNSAFSPATDTRSDACTVPFYPHRTLLQEEFFKFKGAHVERVLKRIPYNAGLAKRAGHRRTPDVETGQSERSALLAIMTVTLSVQGQSGAVR